MHCPYFSHWSISLYWVEIPTEERFLAGRWEVELVGCTYSRKSNMPRVDPSTGTNRHRTASIHTVITLWHRAAGKWLGSIHVPRVGQGPREQFSGTDHGVPARRNVLWCYLIYEYRCSSGFQALSKPLFNYEYQVRQHQLERLLLLSCVPQNTW